jgi:ferritin-like metal-binding protein YciE
VSAPTPPRISNERDLLLAELGRLLSVEETLARVVLPKLERQVEDEKLARCFADHARETRGHAENLRRAFRRLGAEPGGADAAGLDGLTQEQGITSGKLAPALLPFYDACAAVATERYELSGYEAAIAIASALGEAEVVRLLEANRAEDAAALEQLQTQVSRLAQAEKTV